MTGYSTLERAILHRLAESTGKALDLTYASLVHTLGITQRFFQEGGFGDLDVVNFHEDVKSFETWPPEHFADVAIDWRRVRRGSVEGAAYTVFQGTFRTPCSGRAYNALPEESRTAQVRWIAPEKPAPGGPTAIHLAATGDHGFTRREHLAVPLVAKGVGSIALESPFYGMRKPAAQQGAKLRHVSDLLLLGRATIEESLFLLNWLSNRGHERLGVAGLSMGGVHASMVASLYPGPVALTPLLAPRSAGAAYCKGALFHATAWDRLLRDTEGREQEIVAAVEAAAKADERIAASRVMDTEGLAAALRKNMLQAKAVKEAAAEAEAAQQAALKIVSENTKTTSTNASENIAPGEGVSKMDGGQGTAWRWAEIAAWASRWSQSLESQVRRVRRLEAEGDSRHAAAVALLEAVLETFTDATRFPCPRRPDAAVLVAATEDAYVSTDSVLDLHHHLPGSEVRWVRGGHVSSFLLHQPTFREAIVDSLNKL